MKYDPLPLDIGADNALKVVLNVPSWEADVSNPNLPGGPTVRPEYLVLLILPDEKCQWIPSLANVVGPKVGSRSAHPRKYEVPFTSLLDEDSGAPDWVQDEARRWADKLNG